MTTQIIEKTEFTNKATVISLNYTPIVKEQNELFTNDSIVLEF